MSVQDIREEQVQKLRKLFAASDVPNDPKAWDQAWIDSTTPWDANQPQPALVELLDGAHDAETTVDGAPVSNLVPKGHGIALVPGCGRGYDAKLFAERGLTSYGVDISSNAVAAANEWLKKQILSAELATRVHFVEADFFSLGTPSSPLPALSTSGVVDLAYDYTFLCAIPPTLRQSWAETYTRLLKPGAILISLVYPIHGDRATGPPYSLSPKLVRDLLGAQTNKPDETSAWKELADIEPKDSKPNRIRAERVMVWRRL